MRDEPVAESHRGCFGRLNGIVGHRNVPEAEAVLMNHGRNARVCGRPGAQSVRPIRKFTRLASRIFLHIFLSADITVCDVES